MLSVLAAASIWPPTDATVSANCTASREPAPFCSSPARRLATPEPPAGSLTAPPRSTALNAISGTSCRSVSNTTVPLGNCTRSNCGTLTPLPAASTQVEQNSSAATIVLIGLLPGEQPELPL